MLNILANVTDKNMAAQFLNDIEYDRTKKIRGQLSATENRYYDPTSPLSEAQKAADNYMLMKQRKPMVIEYYKEKPTSMNAEKFIESVEMYINPQRLNVQYQKLKGKAITRGGIFYHHWGDDNPIMSLSGTVGYAGMKGIEQLEKIYMNSGALLKYGDLDLHKSNNGTPNKYKPIDLDDISGVIDGVINDQSGVVTKLTLDSIEDAINNAKTETDRQQYNIVKQVILNLKNVAKQSEYQNAYNAIRSDIEKEASINKSEFYQLYSSAQDKITKNKDLQNLSPHTKILMAFDIAVRHIVPNDKSIWSVIDQNDLNVIIKNGDYKDSNLDSFTSKYLGIDSGIIAKTQDIINSQAARLNKYIDDINNTNNSWKIDREESFDGWSDIADEVFDEYRPRLIFIYFEDRVYLGHFDSFNYSRVAENMLIQYELRFTIVRQIIMSRTGAKPANTNSPMANYYDALSKQNPIYKASWLAPYEQDKKSAYLEILKCVSQLTLSNSIHNAKLDDNEDLKNYSLTSDEKENIINKIQQLKSIALEWATEYTNKNKGSINYYKTMINAANYNYTHLLEYFSLVKVPGNDKYGIKEEVLKEYKRIRVVIQKELNNNTLTETRKRQIISWLLQVYAATNVDFEDAWLQKFYEDNYLNRPDRETFMA
jgi:hypothetical protein